MSPTLSRKVLRVDCSPYPPASPPRLAPTLPATHDDTLRRNLQALDLDPRTMLVEDGLEREASLRAATVGLTSCMPEMDHLFGGDQQYHPWNLLTLMSGDQPDVGPVKAAYALLREKHASPHALLLRSNSVFDDFHTPLHAAVGRGRLGIAAWLLDQENYDPSIVDWNSKRPICLAIDREGPDACPLTRMLLTHPRYPKAYAIVPHQHTRGDKQTLRDYCLAKETRAWVLDLMDELNFDPAKEATLDVVEESNLEAMEDEGQAAASNSVL